MTAATTPNANSVASTANGLKHGDRSLDHLGHVVIVVVLILYAAWEVLFLTLGTKLPNVYDEIGFVFEALRLPVERRLGGYQHGVVLTEVIAVVESAWYVMARLAGNVHSPEEFVVTVLGNIHPYLVGCRLVIGVAALLLFVQVYRLGRHFGGPATGGLAALLAATNLTVVTLGTTCKDDVPYWLLMVTAFELSWRTALALNRRLAVWAGAAIGAAMVAKFLGVFAFLLCIVPWLRSEAPDRKRALFVGLRMALAGAFSALVLMPFIITDRTAVLGSIRALSAGASEGLSKSLAIRYYLRTHIPNLIGWACISLGAVEFAIRIRCDRRGPVLLLIVPFTFLVVMGLRPGFSQAYYAMPLALLWMLLTASLVVRIAKSGVLGRWSRVTPVTVILIAALDSAFLRGALKHGAVMVSPETALEARDYLLAHAAPGSCIAVTAGLMGDNFFGPPLVPIVAPVTTGGGVFRRAQRTMIDRAPGPHFDLRIIKYLSYDPAKVAGCEWLVVPSIAPGPLSEPEYGKGGPSKFGLATSENVVPPPGFIEMAMFRGFPEWLSLLRPFYTALDYEQLRHTSLARIWHEGRFGRTQTIYRNPGFAAMPRPQP